MKNLLYIFKTFLLIGSVSFGGYMSLVAMMRERMVTRDKSIDDDRVTEGLALASMLPGPLAVNVVAYTGFYMSGFIGALVGVVAVLLPSFILVLILSIIYFQAGSKVDSHSILLGIFPVVAGVIFSTGISMGKKNCTQIAQIIIACCSFFILFFFKNYWSILIVLALSAGIGMVLFHKQVSLTPVIQQKSQRPLLISVIIFAAFFLIIFVVTSPSPMFNLLKEFSAVSLTLFGGGYVMVPILKSTLVDQLHWLTGEEFIYGISVGQVTPGPILISSVFFGYKIGGVPGAVVAAISIFLPSALLMVILSGVFISLKHNTSVQAALSGIRPAVVGMILYSGISLFQLMNDANLWISLLIAGITFWLVFRYSINAALVIIAGGIAGFFVY